MTIVRIWENEIVEAIESINKITKDKEKSYNIFREKIRLINK